LGTDWGMPVGVSTLFDGITEVVVVVRGIGRAGLDGLQYFYFHESRDVL
jgi:hypothetical protein